MKAEPEGSPDGAGSLTPDCAGLDYISPAGLRALFSAHKRMNSKGGMKVRNVNEIVREGFEATGLCDILTIEKNPGAEDPHDRTKRKTRVPFRPFG